jgi:hypothetical protein
MPYTMAFDIETKGDLSCVPFLPPIEAALNLKDPEKIKQSILDRTAAQLSSLALYHATCLITAIGLSLPDGEIEVHLCPDQAAETEALERFWHWWRRADYRVGFRCIPFDLPCIITRSRLCEVAHPELALRKYGTPGIRDLELETGFSGMQDDTRIKGAGRMAFWIKRYGIALPPDPIEGKDCPALADQNTPESWALIREHCRIDVMATLALAKKMPYGAWE